MEWDECDLRRIETSVKPNRVYPLGIPTTFDHCLVFAKEYALRGDGVAMASYLEEAGEIGQLSYSILRDILNTYRNNGLVYEKTFIRSKIRGGISDSDSDLIKGLLTPSRWREIFNKENLNFFKEGIVLNSRRFCPENDD